MVEVYEIHSFGSKPRFERFCDLASLNPSSRQGNHPHRARCAQGNQPDRQKGSCQLAPPCGCRSRRRSRRAERPNNQRAGLELLAKRFLRILVAHIGMKLGACALPSDKSSRAAKRLGQIAHHTYTPWPGLCVLNVTRRCVGMPSGRISMRQRKEQEWCSWASGATATCPPAPMRPRHSPCLAHGCQSAWQ